MPKLNIQFVLEYYEEDEDGNPLDDTYEIGYDGEFDTESGLVRCLLPNSVDNSGILKQHWMIMPSGTRVPLTWSPEAFAFQIQGDDKNEV